MKPTPRRQIAYLLLTLGIALCPLAATAEPMADAAAAERAGRWREALNIYLEQLRSSAAGSEQEQAVRERIIAIAPKMRPPLALPKEAERLLARGEAAVERAKAPADFAAAVREFREATLVAPWHAPAYYNLGVAQEKAGKSREAIQSYKAYLLAAPQATDAAQVEKRIYKLEYDAEASAAEAAKKSAEARRFDNLGGSWQTRSWMPIRQAGDERIDFARVNDKPALGDPGWNHTLSPKHDEIASVQVSGTRFEADLQFFSRDRGRFVGEIAGRTLRGKMTYVVRHERDAVCPGHIAEFPFEGVVDPDNGRIMLLVRGEVDAQVVGKCYSAGQSWMNYSRLLVR